MKNEVLPACKSIFRSETPELLKKSLTDKWVLLINRAEQTQKDASCGNAL